MKKIFILLLLPTLFLGIYFVKKNMAPLASKQQSVKIVTNFSHWFLLHRKSNTEFLYFGVPGQKDKSTLLKTFHVKSGWPGKKPTPLPSIVGRQYWIIIDKFDATDNPETAPYFLAFDTVTPATYPFGPQPYLECNGQCNWEVAGYFGLHGVAGNKSKLADADPGSSGCVRHSDQDITYIYDLLDPKREEIRYYIKDL